MARMGISDSMGLRQIPYMLAKYVFPLMKYEGYAGLTIAQADAKNAEFRRELKEHWKALKTQEEDASTVRSCVERASVEFTLCCACGRARWLSACCVACASRVRTLLAARALC